MRLVVAVRGGRLDHENQLTQAYLASVRHRYHVEHLVMHLSGRRCAHIYLPTLKAAVDLILACPHLELIGDRYRGTTR